MPGIFVSYRREDSSGHVGRLGADLKERFGAAAVFIDLDSIAPGMEFDVAIQDAMAAADVALIVIGKNWLKAQNSDGNRRLDNPCDSVRSEIATALRNHLRVIPVLVQGASMPETSDLPEEIAMLARRHAMELSDARWDYDLQRLMDAISSIIKVSSEANRGTAQGLISDAINRGDPVAERLRELRRAMIQSRNVRELRKLSYRVDLLLHEHPHNPEARELKDEIEEAERAQGALTSEVLPSSRFRVARSVIALLLTVMSVGILGKYIYHILTPNVLLQPRPPSPTSLLGTWTGSYNAKGNKKEGLKIEFVIDENGALEAWITNDTDPTAILAEVDYKPATRHVTVRDLRMSHETYDLKLSRDEKHLEGSGKVEGDPTAGGDIVLDKNPLIGRWHGFYTGTEVLEHLVTFSVGPQGTIDVVQQNLTKPGLPPKSGKGSYDPRVGHVHFVDDEGEIFDLTLDESELRLVGEAKQPNGTTTDYVVHLSRD